MNKKATLCMLVKDHPKMQVLLGYKKVGFGAGKYTGFGGKVDQWGGQLMNRPVF